MSLLNVKYLYFFNARPVRSILFHRVNNTNDNQNRGTGAGGKATNLNGKQFEELTNNEPRLLSQGFIKKQIAGKRIIYQLAGVARAPRNTRRCRLIQVKGVPLLVPIRSAVHEPAIPTQVKDF